MPRCRTANPAVASNCRSVAISARRAHDVGGACRLQGTGRVALATPGQANADRSGSWPAAEKVAFLQGYSCQLAVDAAHQVIVATDVLQTPNDSQQFIPMLEGLIDNCGEVPVARSPMPGTGRLPPWKPSRGRGLRCPGACQPSGVA